MTVYEHVTIWEGRALVTLTVRHGLEVDIAPVVQAAVAAARHRAVDLADRDG